MSGLALFGAALADPAPLRACEPGGPDCGDFTMSLASTTIAADGVLVFDIPRLFDGRGAAQGSSIIIRDAAGEVVDGAFDGPPFLHGAIVWRPAKPWIPGDGYTVEVATDPKLVDNDLGGCGMTITRGTFTVDTAPLPPVALPPFAEVEELESKHELSLDSLVCCDGAYAWTEDCGEIEWWGDGYCAASQVRRRLVGRLPVDHEALGPTLRYNFAVDLGTWPGALPSWKSSAISTEVVPKCITATFIDLARARSLEHEVCFGQDFTEPLGLQPRDAGEDLGANCVGEAYQCVHDGWNWDPDACGPPGGDGADGCGCRTGASGLGTVLFALGLFALVRPRRLSV